MSGALQTDGDDGETVNGRCAVCGETWIGFARDKYKSVVAEHILTHRDEVEIDEVVVEEFELLGGDE